VRVKQTGERSAGNLHAAFDAKHCRGGDEPRGLKKLTPFHSAFQRFTRKVGMTDAGEEFYRHAVLMLRDIASLHRG
jgi:hypothetical protein